MGDKVALITGASRGIGRACALELAKAGYYIAVSYAGNDEAANKTINDLLEIGVKAKAYKFDVANKPGVSNLMTIYSIIKGISIENNATSLGSTQRKAIVEKLAEFKCFNLQLVFVSEIS